MERFSWQSAHSVPQAAALATTTVADAMLADPTETSVILKAGGIDVLDLMKEDLLRPARLVNLREIPGLDAIIEDDAGVRIGAMATLQQIASHPLLRRRYAALADAAGSSASPQIRNVATLGGNLLQRPRCWYFRSAAHYCARKGGDPCFAFVGENQYHAVFAQDRLRHRASIHRGHRAGCVRRACRTGERPRSIARHAACRFPAGA